MDEWMKRVKVLEHETQPSHEDLAHKQLSVERTSLCPALPAYHHIGLC